MMWNGGGVCGVGETMNDDVIEKGRIITCILCQSNFPLKRDTYTPRIRCPFCGKDGIHINKKGYKP
jgi:hypothetical protein